MHYRNELRIIRELIIAAEVRKLQLRQRQQQASVTCTPRSQRAHERGHAR